MNQDQFYVSRNEFDQLRATQEVLKSRMETELEEMRVKMRELERSSSYGTQSYSEAEI
jgi:hypothetical protein